MTSKKASHRRVSVTCLIATLCLCNCALSAESAEELIKRLNDVTASTSLDAVSMPWHLRLSVTVFDSKGASQDGTVESWRAREESHTVVSFQGGTITEYDHANEHYYSAQGGPVPEIIFDVLDTLLHPGPGPTQLTGTAPELQSHSFGKTTLDCIMLTRPARGNAARLPGPAPLGLFPTYCFAPHTDHLQVFYNFGNPTVLRTSLGKFADHEVTTSVTVSDGPTLLAKGKVLSLSSFVPAAGDFTPPEDLKPIGSRITKIASGVTAGLRLGGDIPQYPASARMDHVSGTVVLRAIIGKDGHIQHLTVMSAPSWDLSISAIQAVHTWTYKPFLLNDRPTAIDTTVTVNYNLSPG